VQLSNLDKHGAGVLRVQPLQVAVEDAKKQFRAFARRNPDPDDEQGYVVPHSAITYVLGPDGEFVAHFTDATERSDMVAALISIAEK
jgi:protein SCO1